MFNSNSNSPQNVDNNKSNKPSYFQRNSAFIKIIAICLAALLVLLLAVGACVGCYYAGQNAQINENMKDDLAVANEIYTLIKQHYYKDITKDEFNYWASLGLSSSMDQFSGLSLASSQMEAKFGITIRNDSYNNHIISAVNKSTDPTKKSPAESAVGIVKGSGEQVRLERGDMLLSVDGKSVQGLTTDVLNGADFFGKANIFTPVEVVCQKSDGRIATFKLTKGLFYSSQAHYQNMGGGIGYIKLDSFTGTAAEDFVRCANAFNANGNSKLILDLRDNGGGSTNILEVIASYLIHDANGKSNGLGIIKLEQQKEGNANIYTAKGDNWLGRGKSNYELAVLVNENSASASEALLGAIKYYCPEATIIGTPTYGKGIAQQTFQLTSTPNYLLSITVGYFYVPVGENKWETYHGKPMMPSEGFVLDKFTDVYDFTADDFYKSYYNNNLLQEEAVKLALQVLS